MTVTAEMLDAMLTAGCTAEQVVAVVKADLKACAREKELKRTKDAQRQREHRERKREVVSRDVTVTPVSYTHLTLPTIYSV